MVTCSQDGSVIVWDPRTAEPSLKLSPGAKDWHNCPVNTVDVSPDNGIIASGGEDGTCKVRACRGIRIGLGLGCCLLQCEDRTWEMRAGEWGWVWLWSCSMLCYCCA